MIAADLATFLAANSGVSALVGAGSAARVYVSRAPQRPTYPLIVITVVSDVGDKHLTGPSGVRDARFQVDAQAASFGSAKAVGDAVLDALDAHSGAMGSATTQYVSVENQRADYEDGADLQRVMSDVRVWYEAA